MTITELTRRDIVDALILEKVQWSGRLDEVTFLSRMYDLASLPSDDRRYSDAAGDISKHRIYNNDWPDEWVFHDKRFGLMYGDDEEFLRFLCETIHPVVRSDLKEIEKLKQLYNGCLKNDGYQLVEKSRLSGKPVFSGKYIGVTKTPAISAMQDVSFFADKAYVAQQIARMEASVNSDPDLAIGTAKELIETCCKTVLEERGIDIPKKADIPKLVRLASKELKLTREDIPDEARAADIIRNLLSNLATITNNISELRNAYGTGHGKSGSVKGLQPRHAKLAVGAASTLAVFLIETHEVRD